MQHSEVILSQSRFFAELSESSRAMLGAVAHVEQIPRKTVLFREGQPGSTMYLLAEGRIQLSKLSPDGQETVLKILKSPDVFAEVILFEKKRYPATAEALTECTVLGFDRTDIRQLLRQEVFRDDFISMLMRKQRYLADRLVYLTTHEVEDRLLQFLHEESQGRQHFELPLARKDIAAAIGTTPETLSRCIQRLQESGQLSWNRREVSLPE